MIHIKRHRELFLLTILFFSFLAKNVSAANFPEDTLYTKPVHRVAVEVAPGYVFGTHRFLEGENAADKAINTTLGFHAKYAFQFGKDSKLGKKYPHVSQGVGIGYHTFFNQAELGSPLMAYVFQQARICKLSNKLSLDYEWNFGASLGWKKYDEKSNDYNRIVGSKMNAYLNLGLLLNWRLSPHWNLVAGISGSHFSNGNTHLPNAGVNTLNARLGVVRTINPEPEEGTPASTFVAQPFKPYFSYDVVIYGAGRGKAFLAPRTDEVCMVPGTFGVVGININPMYNVKHYFRCGVSLDAQYDESANIRNHIVGTDTSTEGIRFHRPPFREQFSAGLSVRAELVMPIFSINFGIGRNFLYKGPDANHFYQVLALKTHLTKRLYLHTGYQLSKFKDPNNLMLGLGYRFNGR